MTTTAPIFLMSSERSGSNLLRTLLSNHSGLAGPMAPQLLDTFANCAGTFGPLEQEDAMVALVDALIQVANHRMFDWNLQADPRELVRAERPGDFVGAFDAVYRAQAAALGARRYVCKENRLFDFADRLIERLDGARILYLVRDPRDYVLSWQQAPLLHNTPFEAAQAWSAEQQACAAVASRHAEQVHCVTYEDLIADTSGAMTAVCAFLGEPAEPACFQVEADKNRGQEWSAFWKNLTRPVQSTNHAKYRSGLDLDEIELVETVCGGEMELLGYRPETGQSWGPDPGFARRNKRMSKVNDILLRERHASTVAVIEDRNRLVRTLVS